MSNVNDLSIEPFENIIHDIKIPMTIMYTKIQALEESENIDKEESNSLEIMKKNWFRIMKLLNDMNDYEKLNQGKINLNLKNLNIISLLKDITESSSSLAIKKNISLKFTSNVDFKLIAIDKSVIERIMLNLISNAIKYSEINSKVIIKATIMNEILSISVKDNGKGIKNCNPKDVFNRYVTSDSNRAKGGIGLSIVKEFVELLKGNVFIKSNKLGTEIIIKLPCYLEENYTKKELHLEDFYSYNIFDIELSDDYNI